MFTITKDHQDNIKTVCGIAASKSSMQSIENILLSASEKSVDILAGDGVVEITSRLDCVVKSGGSCTVNAGKFLSALNAMNFECDVIFKDNAIEVKSGRRKITLTTLDADIYPSYPMQYDAKKIDIVSEALIYNIKKASKSSGVNDARYMLNGVYVGDDIVATNGHRITMIAIKSGMECIIPLESIKKMPLIVGGYVSVSKNVIEIGNDDLVVKSKLLDAVYVNYQRAMGVATRSANVNVAELLDAIKAALITASNESSNVTLSISELDSSVKSKSVKNDASVIGFGAETSDTIELSFNGKYLMDALSFYDGGISLGFSDAQLIISDDVTTNIVMSVRE